MAITLPTINAPGATPISPNAASQKSFDDSYSILASLNGRQDIKTILILSMVYALNTAGGANYKSNHAGLIQDATVYTGGISRLDPWIGITGPAWSGANAGDGTLSSDVPTLIKEGRDLHVLPEATLDRIIAFLGAQLGI